MQRILTALSLLVLVSACATPVPAPTLGAGTPAPSPVAPTASPASQTALPTSAVIPTATAARPSADTPSLTGRIRLMDLPGAGRRPIAIARLGSQEYVANADTNNVAVVENDVVNGFIPVGAGPNALAVDAQEARVYVSSGEAKQITQISAGRVVNTQTLTDAPSALAYADGKLYVGLQNSSAVLVLDGATLKTISTIKLSQGFGIYALAVDPPRQRLYATTYGSVLAIDLTAPAEITTLAVENAYTTVAVRPTNGALWVGAFNSRLSKEFIGEYDRVRGAPLSQVEAGGDLRQAAFDSAGTRLYVASAFDNRVDVIDPQANVRVASIPTGRAPTGLALDEAKQRLYVTNAQSDSMNVIDTTANRVVATIPLAMRIASLAANETSGRVYAANSSSDSVFVIEGGKVVKQVTVGRHPGALARDSRTNTLFIANEADGTLTAIDEGTLTVRSSTFITRTLLGLDIDGNTRRLFAGSTLLDLDSLKPLSTFLARGISVGSQAAAVDVRVNPVSGKFYTVGWNGVPGSNSRNVLYAFSERDPNYQKMISPLTGGSVTAFAIDANTNRVYAAATHPITFKSELNAWTGEDERAQSLALSSRTTGMLINPRTNHIFLSHARTYEPAPGALQKRDNTVQVLDTRSLGEVAWLDVPGGPGPLTRVGDTIYVGGLDDGAVTMIADVAVTQPPAPTATFTPTPYPTLTPAPRPSVTRTSTPPPSPQGLVTPTCNQKLGATVGAAWQGEVAAYLGCAVEDEHTLSEMLARMDFKGGFMLDDFENADAKQAYVIFQDRRSLAFRDTWNESLPVDSCPAVAPPADSVKPQRGFGKIWCENGNVRDKLGAANGPEILTGGARQRFQHGVIYRIDGIGIIVIRDNGTWG